MNDRYAYATWCTEEAFRMYERAIELDPDGGTARNARQQIERLRAAEVWSHASGPP